MDFIYSVEEKTVCTYHDQIIIPKSQIKKRYILKFKNSQIHKEIKQEDFNSKKGARTQAIPPYDLVTPSLNTTRLGLQCQTPALGL